MEHSNPTNERTFDFLIMNMPPLERKLRHFKLIKVTLWIFTQYMSFIPRIWRHVYPFGEDLGVMTL